MNNTKINWFPGHMKKAIDDMTKMSKVIDGIIEIVDSRCVNISSNNEITKIFKNKIITKIATKSDLADLTKKDESILYVNLKTKSDKKIILNHLNNIFSNKISSLIKKGLKKPRLNIMVVGLPNVGKSSFINFLSNKQKLKVENRPGVTRTNQWIEINDNFLLFDTPGILFKNIVNMKDGYILSLINCIKKDVLPIEEVIKFAFEFYMKNYQKQFLNFFNIELQNKNFDFFVNKLAQKYNFINTNKKIDSNRLFTYIYNSIVNGDIVKVNYE